MDKNTKIYCVYCGTENILEDKKCKKCKKELDPKNRPIRDYIYDKVEDKVNGEIQDNIFSLITDFIKKHLYGTVLTCSVVITAVSIVTNVVSNGNEFEVVKERPNIVQRYEYAGTGMTSEEITNAYLEALNNGDLSTLKTYELGTFYPELYEELENVSYSAGELGVNYIFKDNVLYTNRKILFTNEYDISLRNSFYCLSNGKFGEYNFVRYAVYNSYCYEGNCEKEDNTFYVINDIELLEVDGNYYVTGSAVEKTTSPYDKVNYELLLQYNGDVNKFSKQDALDKVEEYLMNLE